MEIRSLVAFVTVAEELHFTRAAEQLFISQPPLTRLIKALESELGFDLFDRTTRSVQLTSGGREFLPYAQRVVAASEAATQAAADIAAGSIGSLGIAFVGSAAWDVLPQAVRRFRSEHPNVATRLTEMNSGLQIDALLEGRIDVGITRSDSIPQGIAVHVVSRSPLVIAMPENHRLAARPSVTLGELANEDFVSFPKRTWRSLSDITNALCEEAGFTPRVSQVATAMQTVLGLVAVGLGIAIVPKSRTLMTFPGLHVMPLEGDLYSEIRACTRADSENPALEHFLEILLQK